jgi:hypothetical protein
MAKAEATVEELVSKIERGELRLPEMQRRYVWRSTRVRDLLDSLYRGYPSGAILIWETDEPVPELVEQTWSALEPQAFEAFSRQLDAPASPNERLQRTMAAPRPWQA